MEKSRETIGRTWGHRGLKKVVRTVQFLERDCIEISRLLRRMKRHVKVWSPQKGRDEVLPALREEWRPRGSVIGYEFDAEGVLQPVQKGPKIKVRRKAMSGRYGAGYSLTPHGPDLARLIYRHLISTTAPEAPPTSSLQVFADRSINASLRTPTPASSQCPWWPRKGSGQSRTLWWGDPSPGLPRRLSVQAKKHRLTRR